jgi:hypothetical protein
VIAAALGVATSSVLLSTNSVELQNNVKDIIISVFSVGVLEPIMAEFVFRGLTLNSLQNQKLWTAIFIQAGFGAIYGLLFFGLTGHALGFLLGVFLGFIYTRFRSIWLPISAGVAFSVANIAASYILSTQGSAIRIAAIIIGAAIAGACFFLLLKLKRPKPITAYEVLAEQRAELAEAERRETEEQARRGMFYVAPREEYYAEPAAERNEAQRERITRGRTGSAAIWRAAVVAFAVLIVLLIPTFELVDADDNPHLGSWEGDTFTNEQADIRFTIPEDFRRLTDNELVLLFGTMHGRDFTIVEKNDKNMKIQIALSFTPLATFTDDEVPDEEEFLGSIVSKLEEISDADVEVWERSARLIAGERYSYIRLFIGGHGFGDYYARESGDALIVITTQFLDEADRERVNAIIDSIEPTR